MSQREPQQLSGALGKIAAIMRSRDIDPNSVAEWPGSAPQFDALALADARIPPRYQQAQAAHPAVRHWVRQLTASARPGPNGTLGIAHGPSILLLGPTGTGKTHEAYGSIRSLLAEGVRLLWQASTHADLNAMMRPRPGADGERDFQELRRAPLLLLDDLGATSTSSWTEENLYRLLDFRYTQILPTVLTSNLPLADLKAVLGDRIASRLRQMSTLIVLDGDDRRQPPSAA